MSRFDPAEITSIYADVVGTPNCGSYNDEDYSDDYEFEEDRPSA